MGRVPITAVEDADFVFVVWVGFGGEGAVEADEADFVVDLLIVSENAVSCTCRFNGLL